MKRTFTVETNKPDSNGDIVNLDGVHIPDKVPVTVDWDHSKFIGMASVTIEGEELKATAEIPDKYLDAYPAIGFTAIKYNTNGKGKTFEKVKLYEVSICARPNANPDIKTIREQTIGK
jgi:hypothetical protein